MLVVKLPNVGAGDSFTTCISRVRNKAMKIQLMAIRPNIEAAANDYISKAGNSELHLISTMNAIGAVPGDEMVKTYNSRMAKKGQPGRPIYDQIKLLPNNDLCPLCGHRNISSLDHFLPKESYPIFAVTPVNLIGCCSDCNKLKSDDMPTGAADTILHPYFDDVSDQQWLVADVTAGNPAALTFRVVGIEAWDDLLNARIANQFELLELARLYASQAAQEITDIRLNLQRHYDSGGAESVRSELNHQWGSRRANRQNSWQTATYKALAESDWYCDGGFSQV